MAAVASNPIAGRVAADAECAGGVIFNVNAVTATAQDKTLPRKGAAGPLQSDHAAGGLICPDACSIHPGLLKNQTHAHGFISAVCLAFDRHLPLALRPEHFWELILQAVALHVRCS